MAKNTETARIAALAEELLQALESQRRLGGEAYPPTLRQLAELCEGSPPVELVIKAAGKKPFSEKAAVDKENRQPKLDSAVYFKEDKPSKAELAKREIGGLAERMLKVVESQRRLGSDAYPLPLRRLVELCGLKASDARVPGIVGHEALADHLVVAGMTGKKPNLNAPAFLKEDSSSILPSLALFALNVSRTGAARAFTAKQLTAKLIPALKKPVEALLAKDQVEHHHLPKEMAWIPAGRGEPLFFHLDDLRPAASQRAIETPHETPDKPRATVAHSTNGVRHPSGRDFSEAFHQAFEQLDQRNRSTNFVKLSDLRRALSEFARDEFDAGLRRLRLDAQYSLNSHEGLHGSLTQEDREAGVQEVGSLYIYASRR